MQANTDTSAGAIGCYEVVNDDHNSTDRQTVQDSSSAVSMFSIQKYTRFAMIL